MRQGGSLDGTRLLVVGASSGVGRAIGLAAAAAGASVAFAARRLELLKTAVDEAGTLSLAVVCDVTDPSSVVETVEGAVKVFGGLDAVVYGTGVDPLIRIEDVEADALVQPIRHQRHRRVAGRAGGPAPSACRQRSGRLHIGHVRGPAASRYGCLRRPARPRWKNLPAPGDPSTPRCRSLPSPSG